MINDELAHKICVTGPSEMLRIKWKNSVTFEEQNSKRVSLKSTGQNEDIAYNLNNDRTVANLSLLVQSIDMKNISMKQDYLEKVKI